MLRFIFSGILQILSYFSLLSLLNVSGLPSFKAVCNSGFAFNFILTFSISWFILAVSSSLSCSTVLIASSVLLSTPPQIASGSSGSTCSSCSSGSTCSSCSSGSSNKGGGALSYWLSWGSDTISGVSSLSTFEGLSSSWSKISIIFFNGSLLLLYIFDNNSNFFSAPPSLYISLSFPVRFTFSFKSIGFTFLSINFLNIPVDGAKNNILNCS